MANLIIKPTSGGSLILQDEGGTAAHTIDASGNHTLSGTTNNVGTVTAGTISTGVTHNHKQICKAWGRIENNVLTNNHGISGITTANAGSNTRSWTITMSPAMANDDYAVVTTGYAHEGGQVEGSVQWSTGGSPGMAPTTTQFVILYAGNGTPDIDCIGFAVFGT